MSLVQKNKKVVRIIMRCVISWSVLILFTTQEVHCNVLQVVSYLGHPVNLPCQSSVPVFRVKWILETADGNRITIASYIRNLGPVYYDDSPLTGRIVLVNPSLYSATIQISDARVSDEGRYVCEYLSYPESDDSIINLIVLAKPRNSASTVTATASNKPVLVAWCEATHGRPKAQIQWVALGVNGHSTAIVTEENDGTVTVHSQLILTPTAADHRKDISCVITHCTQAMPDTLPMRLNIEYPPVVSIMGYDKDWYEGRTDVELTCLAQGNPIPSTVTWRTMFGQMPDTVQITQNKLKVLRVDESINTTFFCEASNTLGTGKGEVRLNVRGTDQLSVNKNNSVPTVSVVAGVTAFAAVVFSLLAALYWWRHHNRNTDDAAVAGRWVSQGKGAESEVVYENDSQERDTTPTELTSGHPSQNTTQPDCFYQSLDPNTMLPYADYQRLHRNTTQTDAV